MTNSLGTAFPAEIVRAQEILAMYKEIGVPGGLGVALIEPILQSAKLAWEEQDTEAMIKLYPQLQAIE